MVKNQRILFLDVDGPLIPSGMYIINRMASWERICSPICIAIVNRMCEDADAKIVFNTTHNKDGARALADLVREGIKEPLIHDVPMTQFPTNGHGPNQRWWAIQRWIEKSGEEIDWVALDDEHFTEDPRLLLVDFDVGVTLKHLNMARKRWGLDHAFII